MSFVNKLLRSEPQHKSSLTTGLVLGFQLLLSIDLLLALGVVYRFATGGVNGTVQAIAHAMGAQDIDQVPGALGTFATLICVLMLLTLAAFFILRYFESRTPTADTGEMGRMPPTRSKA